MSLHFSKLFHCFHFDIGIVTLHFSKSINYQLPCYILQRICKKKGRCEKKTFLQTLQTSSLNLSQTLEEKIGAFLTYLKEVFKQCCGSGSCGYPDPDLRNNPYPDPDPLYTKDPCNSNFLVIYNCLKCSFVKIQFFCL